MPKYRVKVPSYIHNRTVDAGEIVEIEDGVMDIGDNLELVKASTKVTTADPEADFKMRRD